jgi:hypothetical protein
MASRRALASPRRIPRSVLALLLLVGQAGCATLQHSLSVSDVAGRTLSTRGTEGAERLRSELEVDVTLRDFVERYGRPDYLHVVDRMSLYFFYVEDDMAARFERDLIPPSTAQRLGRIPGSLIDLLPEREVDKLVARREQAKRAQARADAARPRKQLPTAPAPAARSSGGYTISTFDVRQIVARLRPPLTAADAGISGWRSVRFADGKTGSMAKVGGTQYEVRADRLVLAMHIDASRRTPPGQARVEILRLNGAIFGNHAQAITEQVMSWASRVASDRSGRTPIAQRVRGRMLRIDRVPSSSMLVYTVLP